MCVDAKVGLLEKREDWQEQLRELFASDKEQEYVSCFHCPNVSWKGCVYLILIVYRWISIIFRINFDK